MSADIKAIDEDWFCLIPSRFPPVDIYERVSPEADWPALLRVEELTNPRVRAKAALIGVDAVDVGSPQLQNWNHAPFTYLNPEGTWLLPARYGALELSDCLQTALAASIRRREQFLSRTHEPETNLDMRVISRKVSGTFIDLSRVDLLSMPKEERWKIGETAHKEGASGILFASPYRVGGLCLAVFTSHVLGRAVQAEHYRFIWDGAAVRATYSFSDARKLLPSDIFSEQPLRTRAA